MSRRLLLGGEQPPGAG
jgi:hypothetical protein